MIDGLTSFYNQNSVTINLIGVNAILGLSLFFTLSTGLLSLANAAFAGIGAYTAALLTIHAHAPFLICVLAGGFVAVLFAAPLGLPVLRLRGVFLAIATIGFGEVVRIVLLNWDYVGGGLGLHGIPQRTHWWHIWLVVALLLYGCWRLQRSRAGYAFAAIRQDEPAAATLGINTTVYKLLAFVIGAFVASVAGGLQAHLRFVINPNDYGFACAVDILTYAVVSGMTVFAGPVLGAGLITILPEALRHLTALENQPGADRRIVSSAVLLLVILFLPTGIFSLPKTRLSMLAVRIALRAVRT